MCVSSEYVTHTILYIALTWFCFSVPAITVCYQISAYPRLAAYLSFVFFLCMYVHISLLYLFCYSTTLPHWWDGQYRQCNTHTCMKRSGWVGWPYHLFVLLLLFVIPSQHSVSSRFLFIFYLNQVLSFISARYSPITFYCTHSLIVDSVCFACSYIVVLHSSTCSYLSSCSFLLHRLAVLRVWLIHAVHTDERPHLGVKNQPYHACTRCNTTTPTTSTCTLSWSFSSSSSSTPSCVHHELQSWTDHKHARNATVKVEVGHAGSCSTQHRIITSTTTVVILLSSSFSTYALMHWDSHHGLHVSTCLHEFSCHESQSCSATLTTRKTSTW